MLRVFTGEPLMSMLSGTDFTERVGAFKVAFSFYVTDELFSYSLIKQKPL